MVGNYTIIFIMILTVLALGLALLSLGVLVRPHRPTRRKLEPYESGVPNVEPVHARYTPRFYVIAILFVIFDIEAIFLFPWAVAFDRLGLYGLIEMISFIVILLVGYVYAWRKGALEWV
ncbi:MAG TPA: NADH-quinone oxidoreductase subunit A [Thermomicrobiales bacterium]|nr:NADH-quinone oxidoreductase subunit A [Thermomicrobiales bacterium]